MRLFRLQQGDLYISNDALRDNFIRSSSDAQDHLDRKLDRIFENRPEYREYIDLYGKLHGLDRYALLAAHGQTHGQWVYFDEDEEHTVQSWIGEVDGRYAGLVLYTCNPGHHTPASQKSILVVPDSDITTVGAYPEKDTTFSLVVPGVGEIDSYIIEYETEQLKKRLKKK